MTWYIKWIDMDYGFEAEQKVQGYYKSAHELIKSQIPSNDYGVGVRRCGRNETPDFTVFRVNRSWKFMVT